VASSILEEEVPKQHTDKEELEYSLLLEQIHERTQAQMKTRLEKTQPAT
jgi:hypothetical protein